MKKMIREKIELMKSILEEEPFYLVIGDIREESDPNPNVKKDSLQDYYYFLNEYSSLRCGSIIIFGRKEVSEFQFTVADMPGEFEEWICIGKIDSYPLYINKKSGQICCLIGDSGMEMKIECYGDFYNFLENYVFGEQYVETGGKDDWYDLLKTNKLI